MPTPMPWPLIVACSIGMFAATASGSARSPFLLDMADYFSVGLPAIANLFGVTSIAWGLSAWLAGLASDRVGRRVFLIGGPLLLALAMVAVAQSGGYQSLVAFIFLGGLACGAFTATSMAEVSLKVASNQRGRALGWIMAGQSLTLLIGVPLAAWMGATIGWRGVHWSVAVLALFSAGLLLATTGGVSRSRGSIGGGTRAPHMRVGAALNGPVLRLFVALILERVCFGMSAFYYPAFLRVTYDLSIDAVALPLVGFALGNIVGTVLGGQIADRFPYRRVSFAAMLLVAGAFALAWFVWRPGLIVTVALGVGFSLFDALARPSLMAAMADVPEGVRGVVMGLNSSVASVGWLTAALLGGWLYAGVGFTSFGPVMLGMCVVGAFTVLPDSRIRQRY